MIVQSDKMLREQSISSRVSSSSPPAASAPDSASLAIGPSSLSPSGGAGGMLYPSHASAAAAAAAAALSMAGAFPFGPFGTLGGLRMLANQPFPAGMLGIRHPLLPFGLQQHHHPTVSSASSPSPSGSSSRPYPFPYSSPSPFPQQQQQQPIPQQRHPQQLASPACGSASGADRMETERGGNGERRNGSGLLPHTPPTSPSLDENTDLNKTGKTPNIFPHLFHRRLNDSQMEN